MANIAGALGAVAGLLFGGGGSVTLGSVTFQSFEVPERLTWGSEQRVIKHLMPGGNRVYDILGADDAPIEWSGIFNGANAQSRARQVDAICKAGKTVTLSWLGESRTVIVESFSCDTTFGGWLLPYRIKCCVMPTRPQSGLFGGGLLGSFGQDIAQSLGLTGLVNDVQSGLQSISPYLQTAQTYLGQVQAALPVVGSLVGGSSAFIGVSQAINGAAGVVGSGISLAGGQISAISAVTQVGQLIPGASGASAASALNTASQAAGALAGLTAAGGFLTRMGANAANAAVPTAPVNAARVGVYGS
jgi:hypothetical protein